MAKRRGPTPARPWEPLRPARIEGDKRLFARYGLGEPEEVWGSSLYTCIVRYARQDGETTPLGRDGLLWLSIHRTDRKAIHDWRHLQAIKNDVAGPERVALEVYPAESDLVDTSNEYHLWVLPVGIDLPFGFGKGGLVMDHLHVRDANETDKVVGGGKAQQRPWQPGLPTGAARPDWERPADPLARYRRR